MFLRVRLPGVLKFPGVMFQDETMLPDLMSTDVLFLDALMFLEVMDEVMVLAVTFGCACACTCCFFV